MKSIYTNFAEAIDFDAQHVIEIFTFAKGWESKYRQIMLLGKKLPTMSDEDKTDEVLVKGCESQVWLHCDQNEQKQFYFAADSDARIVKGLVVIVLAAFNGLKPSEIAEFNIEDYFAKLDLLKHLSPSRSNGIHAIIAQIKHHAA